MRIAVDATPLLRARTGVAAFTISLLEALSRSDNVDLAAYALSWRGRDALDGALPPGVRALARPMAARPLRWAWLRSDRPAIEWWTGLIDVVHGTNFVAPPTRRAGAVVTVHDLTAVRYPELCESDSLQHPELVRRALRRGAHVHAPSQFVAAEVCDLFDVSAERVHAVWHGIPPVDTGDPEPLPSVGPYILALGTVEPRKDLPTLVRAFDAVAAEDGEVRLVVAGAAGWGIEAFDAAVAAARHRERIVRVGYVTAEERVRLLRGAAAFAFPSVYEGFGFPPLEAMAMSVPVVATRAGALPEVLGDAACLVAPRDIAALAAALGAVLRDESLRSDLVDRGRRRCAEFTWERTAAEMVEVYAAASAAR